MLKTARELMIPAALSMLTFLGLNQLIKTHVLAETAISRLIIQVERLNTGPDFIFLGDSHTEAAVDGNAARVLNAASAGDEFFDFILKADWLISKFPNTKTFVIQADPHLFTSNEHAWNSLNPGVSAILTRKRSRLIAHEPAEHVFLWLISTFPLLDPQIRTLGKLQIAHDIDRFFSPFEKQARPDDGWYSLQSQAVKTRLAEEKVELHALHTGIQPLRIREFRTLIRLVKDSGNQIYLILPPVSSEYRNAASMFGSVSAVDSLLKAVGLPVMDFRSVDDSQGAGIFRDPNHLSARHAPRFTALVLDSLYPSTSRPN